MVESRPLVIPDIKDPKMLYQATAKDGKVTVIHKPVNPEPGMIGSGGTMQEMSVDEFKQFLLTVLPDVKLEKTPAQDSFERKAS